MESTQLVEWLNYLMILQAYLFIYTYFLQPGSIAILKMVSYSSFQNQESPNTIVQSRQGMAMRRVAPRGE